MGNHKSVEAAKKNFHKIASLWKYLGVCDGFKQFYSKAQHIQLVTTRESCKMELSSVQSAASHVSIHERFIHASMVSTFSLSAKKCSTCCLIRSTRHKIDKTPSFHFNLIQFCFSTISIFYAALSLHLIETPETNSLKLMHKRGRAVSLKVFTSFSARISLQANVEWQMAA